MAYDTTPAGSGARLVVALRAMMTLSIAACACGGLVAAGGDRPVEGK
jgi:hypothetical protein